MPLHQPAVRPGFRHRPENSGIIGSICLKCFATIARTRAEEDLAQFERAHVCNSADLERFQCGSSLTRESN